MTIDPTDTNAPTFMCLMMGSNAGLPTMNVLILSSTVSPVSIVTPGSAPPASSTHALSNGSLYRAGNKLVFARVTYCLIFPFLLDRCSLEGGLLIQKSH